MEYRDLSPELLERYPVWKWNSSTDALCPVETYDPLPIDETSLFIKARFTTAGGERFEGYLIGSIQFYACGLFIDGVEHVVNLRLSETIAIAEAAMQRKFGKQMRLLPLRYESSLRFFDKQPIEGVLEVPQA